jgi:hypothetical protein
MSAVVATRGIIEAANSANATIGATRNFSPLIRGREVVRHRRPILLFDM